MGKTTITIDTSNDLPSEVLLEHVRWAVEDLTKETGGAKVTLDSPNPRSHPFEGGVEVFDDHDGSGRKPFASGGYVPGTHSEGGFLPPSQSYYTTGPDHIIPREVSERLGRPFLDRMSQAIRDGRNNRGGV